MSERPIRPLSCLWSAGHLRPVRTVGIDSTNPRRKRKALKVGNGLDPDTQIGPLVSEQQMERVTGYLSTGRQEGA
jgi:Aldehyde dehydrogenase family